MHSGFEAVRTHLQMNCRARRPGEGRGPGVDADIDRIRAAWCEARERHGADGEFLFGRFSAADAMYAPVVSRFQTYGIDLAGVEAEYARSILGLPAVEEWMSAAAAEPWSIAAYDEA
jgi:glutathione S-transferase